PLVSRQNRFTSVCGVQPKFGEFRAVPPSHLCCQNIFELVGYFAKPGETASRGIAFERVHNATHAADDFFIRRSSFQLQPRLVQGLEELVRALKKECAKLRATILGRKAHPFTSRR